MLIELIRDLYQYNAWANARILDHAAKLSREQLGAEASLNFGSVHDALVHTLSVQWLWLMRWQSRSPMALFDPHTFPDFSSISTRWSQIERDTQDFISACTETDLTRVVMYRNFQNEEWAYPLWQQVLHQANHAVQHRSEVAMVLTAWGFSPGPMDFLYYVDQVQKTKL
ncbi:MAG: DinB family protein [Anaerolineaceae bacterium]|nr:DinB family protein [Anaerolineaceae bacterium]